MLFLLFVFFIKAKILDFFHVVKTGTNVGLFGVNLNFEKQGRPVHITDFVKCDSKGLV